MSPKIIPKELKGTNQWMKDEVHRLREMYQRNPQFYSNLWVYNDLPEKEQSREYYMERIKDFFSDSTQPGGR